MLDFESIFRATDDEQIIGVVYNETLHHIFQKKAFPLLIWEKIWKWEVKRIYVHGKSLMVEVIADE